MTVIMRKIEVIEEKEKDVKDVPCSTQIQDITNISRTGMENSNENVGETCRCRESG